MSISPEISAQIVALVNEGRSRRSVALQYNLAHGTVNHIYRRYVATGSFVHRPRSGRPRATDIREDRNIVRIAMRNPYLTSNRIAGEVNFFRNVPVNSRTVCRRLREHGLRNCKPAQVPILTSEHRRRRLSFARNHVQWRERDWRRVFFSDESRFSPAGPDGRVRVWRRPGQRYAQRMFTRRSNFFGGSVMVWGGISRDARTDLHFCDSGTVNASVYIEDILLNYVVPYMPFVGVGSLFMQDNARPHVARRTLKFLEEVEIALLEWPACSPDLNPIEHVWDKLGRRIRARNPPVNSLNALRTALREEWEAIPQEEIRALIDSMPSRLRAVIRARGGNTRY